jgi:hypothetical protein
MKEYIPMLDISKQEAEVPEVIVAQVVCQNDCSSIWLYRENSVDFVLIFSLISPDCACYDYELPSFPVHWVLHPNYIGSSFDACIKAGPGNELLAMHVYFTSLAHKECCIGVSVNNGAPTNLSKLLPERFNGVPSNRKAQDANAEDTKCSTRHH